MEQRVGKKIQKWDEVNGAVTDTVDVTVEVPGDAGKANPMRSLEDQIEQNDNMLDGIINNLPEETIAEKEERTSTIAKLRSFVPEKKEREPKFSLPQLELE